MAKRNYGHNHGAANSGVRSEQRFKNFISSEGMNLLKLQGEFEDFGLPYLTRMKVPGEMENLDSLNQFKYFQNDGYIPELDVLLESKYSEKKGTTEEKIFYDLYKASLGIYENPKSENTETWYVIWGPQAKVQPIYAFFEKLCVEREIPLKVIRVSTLDELRPYIEERKRKLQLLNG